MRETEVVYVIEHIDSGMTKIGITSDWFSRSIALKVHQETKLIGLFESSDMEEAERELHRFARKQRLPGSEYFCLTKQQQENVLTKARETNREIEDLTGLYREMTNNPFVDVTKAVYHSACDWLRLNTTSWKHSISHYCDYADYEGVDKLEGAICKRQIQQMALLINDMWGIGASEQIASDLICDHFFRLHKASLDKKLFDRRSYGLGGVNFYLKPKVRDDLFKYLTFAPAIGSKEIVVKGVRVEAETLRFLLRRWVNYRGSKYCNEAIDSLVDRKRFSYYLSCCGPMTSD